MVNIAILGFGVVGGGTAEVLTMNKALIEERLGEKINIKYILDLREFPDSPFADKIVHDYNIILNDKEVSIVAEMMGGSHPAFDFSLQALKAKKNVVTSNKEVVANFGDELLACAKENGVRYMFEASVGGGIPIIHPTTTDLAGNEITEISGILNGTTNYILTKMFADKKTFDSALDEAKAKGYAEANPSADIDGIDACRKICILAALSFGKLIKVSDIQTEGITKIRSKDVATAGKAGYAVKLIGHTKKENGKIAIMVSPRLIPMSYPLAHINDVFNGISVKGNAIGEVMFYGPGAGKLPTASAVVADIINIISNMKNKVKPTEWTPAAPQDLFDMNDYECKSFICIKNTDKASLEAAFGKIEVVDDSEGEISFITENLKERDFASQSKKFELVSRIRVL